MTRRTHRAPRPARTPTAPRSNPTADARRDTQHDEPTPPHARDVHGRGRAEALRAAGGFLDDANLGVVTRATLTADDEPEKGGTA